MLRKFELSIPFILLIFSKIKQFYETNLEFMEPKREVRTDTLFPDLCFQGFWNFSYVYGAGDKLPYTQARVYCNQWSHSGYKLFLLVELVFKIVYCS